MNPTRLHVNGKDHELELEPRTLLVHALRNGLGLTGTKVGCDTSQCGACTVLLDGRTAKSCTLLAVQAQGREVTTIEGLAPDGELHPVQEAFRVHHGMQCGFCTPGMVLTAVDLLAHEPSPDRELIREQLAGNLCRCTGYQPIVEAIEAAAGNGSSQSTQAEMEPTGALGVPRPRVESRQKLTGATAYASDREIPRLLHARLVLSPLTRARIDRIDANEALALPGVRAVLTASDFPAAERAGVRHLEPLARDEVVFAGQPVALVAADSEAAAEDGAAAVLVDYTPLTPVLDLEGAVSPGAAAARPEREQGQDGGDDSPNIASTHVNESGDVDAALASCDLVVEGRFKTNWVYQAPLEAQTATAWVEPDGQLVVHSSTQASFFTRDRLAGLFDLPLSRVRVVATPSGGAFGAKLVLSEPLVAGAALRLQSPVRLAMTRSEEVIAGQPAPASILDLRVGARSSGELVALDAHFLFDTGAFADWSSEVVVAYASAGPYLWPSWHIDSRGVFTNRFGRGAYRAPGGPQSAFALESLLDRLAEELELDPIELRRRNLPADGDPRVDGSTWPPIGARECLDELEKHPLWAERASLPDGEGVGVALGLWTGSLHAGSAICRLNGDGQLTVITGLADISSNETSLTAVAAEAFGVPTGDVSMVFGHTDSGPFAPLSGGSVVTYSQGRAVQRAAEAARESLLKLAAPVLEVDPDDLEVVGGVVRPIGAPERGVDLATIAAQISGFGGPMVEGHAEAKPPVPAPAAAAHLSHVRFDAATAQVELLRHVIAQDVGRAINPAMVEGQMRGGVVQGIGWALHEELVHDDEGQLLTASFHEYAIPAAEQVPELETIIVEVPSAEGPFGARGVGEAPVVSAAAAVANGLAAASGVRMRELPMTPERIWRARGNGQ
jgi:CO/xanthine dehydrogenase Mo-binding subunit/aerobic-type carbon monoxide dehydrogenase small subunit (CoxS/CutS family)